MLLLDGSLLPQQQQQRRWSAASPSCIQPALMRVKRCRRKFSLRSISLDQPVRAYDNKRDKAADVLLCLSSRAESSATLTNHNTSIFRGDTFSSKQMLWQQLCKKGVLTPHPLITIRQLPSSTKTEKNHSILVLLYIL